MAGLFQTAEKPYSENYAVYDISSSSPGKETQTANDGDDGSCGGTMIGVLGTLTPPPIADLGYNFHPSSWGKGYATEAITAFVERFWALQPAVQAIRAEVDTQNIASIRVLQKCGFVEVETIKGGGRKLPLMGSDDGPRDVVSFRIERPEKT